MFVEGGPCYFAIVLKSQKRQPESSAAAGRVKTQAIAMSRTVESCRPLLFAAMVPSHARRENVRRTDWKAIRISSENGAHRNKLGRGALSVREVGLADLFANRDDDALPANHGAETKCQSDRDLDPGGNEAGRLVEEGLVIGDDLGVASAYPGARLCQYPERFAGQVHLITDVGLHLGRDAAERAVGGGLVADVSDLLLKGEDDPEFVLLGADEMFKLGCGVLQDCARLDIVVQRTGNLRGDGGEGLHLFRTDGVVERVSCRDQCQRG